VGTDDRDYIRERRLRWDEHRGQTQLDDAGPPRSSSHPRWWWIAAGVALLVAFAAGGVRYGTPRTASAATEGQESGNPVLIGTVTQVLDGDTIKVALDPGPITVRFGSIDTPEKSQPAGPAAREVLTRRLGHVKAARYCTAEESTAGGCRIKGNVGSSGKVYHVPGSGAYDKTVITESKGERWFCTKEEARAAGWRAPRG